MSTNELNFFEKRRIRRDWEKVRAAHRIDTLARMRMSNRDQYEEDMRMHAGRDRAITAQDMPDLQRELRDAAAQLLKTGTDRIHYFHAGPAAVAALVGAEFANGACVLFYPYGGGSYTNFGPIRPAAPAA